MLRLIAADERVRPKRRTPRTVTPSSSSKTTEEPTTSKSRGRRLTLTPRDLTSRIASRTTSESAVLRHEDHAVGVVGDDRLRASGR